jgi:hypothetical protein
LVRKDPHDAPIANSSTLVDHEKHNWAPSKAAVDTEPAGKRVRLN